MAPDDSKKDPTVKDLLEGESLDEVVDEATRRELERWFSLPSFEESEGKPERKEDPAIAEVRERRAKAIESVDRALLETVATRYEGKGERLIQFWPDLEVHADPDIAQFDHVMLAKVATIADPREIERPEDIEDDLKDRAPQAILRDLHRPETDFDKTFERVDMAAEQRLDIVAEVDRAMKTSWKLPPLGKSPFVEGRELVEEVRQERGRRWADIPSRMKLTNRRVDE